MLSKSLVSIMQLKLIGTTRALAYLTTSLPTQANSKSVKSNKYTDRKLEPQQLESKILKSSKEVPAAVLNLSDDWYPTAVGYLQEDAESQYFNLVATLSSFSAEESHLPNISFTGIGDTVNTEDYVKTIPIGRLQINNHSSLNTYTVLENALREANSDDSTRVVVLTGSCIYFFTGNHFFPAFSTDVMTNAKERKATLRSFVASLIDCKKPIIALVNGSSAGIGTNILGLVDIAYCTDKAILSGKCYLGGYLPKACSSFTFPRIMGYSKSNEFHFLGSKLTPESAESCGLISQIFSKQTFETETRKRVRRLALLSTQELIAIKDSVRGKDRPILHDVNDYECDQLVKKWLS